jgi:hypothetical protein
MSGVGGRSDWIRLVWKDIRDHTYRAGAIFAGETALKFLLKSLGLARVSHPTRKPLYASTQ